MAEIKKYDVVFLHPGGNNKNGLQGPFFPIGMVGLASYLNDYGYNVCIFNLLLEKILDNTITDEIFINSIESGIFCIDLHWFVHSYEAITLAKLIKNVYPGSVVVIGGLTASFFADEIMTHFEFIDIIIKGEAEKPLKMIVDNLKEGIRNLHDIPNLTYRYKNKIINNPITYIIDQIFLDNIDFLNFELVHNWDKTLHLQNTDYQFSRDHKKDELGEYYQPGNKSFYMAYTGRGCNFNCFFCGGSYNAFIRCFNRSRIILRNPEKVADDIIKLDSLGVNKVYIPHSPLIINTDYHDLLLNAIMKKTNNLNIGFHFEDFPFFFDYSIHKKYSEIFNPENSVYFIYIGNLDKKIALLNKCYIPLEKISTIQKFGRESGISVKTCITLGMPGDNFNSTYLLGNYLKHCLKKNLEIEIYKSEMHPASDLFVLPEKFNIKKKLTCFLDFYKFLEKKDNKSMLCGFEIDGNITIDDQYDIITKILSVCN